MPKRDLFKELKETLEDVRDFEKKKITLKTTNYRSKREESFRGK